MSARKPFTMRQRRRWPQHSFGHRPTNNWGSGDLPAPWAAGDVVQLVGEHPDRLDDMKGPYFVVDTAFSIDEGDAWYFRVTDGTERGGYVASSGRLHVAFADRSSWAEDMDWMAPFKLVETGDPEGLAERERLLAEGWALRSLGRCEACGQYLPPPARLSSDHAIANARGQERDR